MSNQILNEFVSRGTTAERTAFTPSSPTPATGPDPGYFWWDTDTQTAWAYDFGMADWVELAGGGGGGNVNAGGTLTSNAIVIGQGSTDVAVTTTAAGILTFIGTPSSANLASALTDETGTGAAVFANTPTLVTPILGTPTSGALTNCTSIPVNQATGDLPFANLTQIAGLSVLGVTGSATADVAAITAGTDGHVLTRVSSSSLAFAAPSGGGVSLLEQHTASSSASLDFTTAISSTYDTYLIELVDLVPASNNVALLMRMSTDGGSTYDSGGNYDTSNLRVSSVGNASNGSTTATSYELSAGGGIVSTTAEGGFSGSVTLFNPGSATFYKRIAGNGGYRDNGNLSLSVLISGAYRVATAVNAFQFLMSSGNIASGTIRVYGMAK